MNSTKTTTQKTLETETRANHLGPKAEAALKAKAKEQAGVLLPGVDPTIGEMLLATLLSNPDSSMSEVMLGLIDAAPVQIRHELLEASYQLAVCKERGQLVWLVGQAQAVLVGIKELPMRGGYLTFGSCKWPMSVLTADSPNMVRVRVMDHMVPIWTSCTGLSGVAIQQPEAEALGRVILEAHGASVVNENSDPSKRDLSNQIKMRAAARAEVKEHKIKQDHARVALAEAKPGILKAGDVLKPDHVKDVLFEVERRISSDYVQIRSMEPGVGVAPGSWLYEDERVPKGMEGVHGFVGFTEDSAVPSVRSDETLAAEEEGTEDA